jgi:hypothetical protein
MHQPRKARASDILLQLIRGLVEAGFDTGLVLVTARRPGSAGRADDILVDFDRERAGQGDDIGQVQEIAEYRISLDALDQRTGGTAQSARYKPCGTSSPKCAEEHYRRAPGR